MVINRSRVDARMIVQPTLALVLDMYDTDTTAQGLANYLAEQCGLPKPYYDEPMAVAYLVALAHALTPPDDQRMSFRDRPLQAARAAVPWDFGEAMTTIMELGWGSLAVNLTFPASVKEAGEAARSLLVEKTEGLARDLLLRWESAGHVYRLDTDQPRR